MFLHATADLRKRFRLADTDCAALASPAPVNSPLGSWYGHINRVHRCPVVALLHAVTRYTVVFDGRGLKDWNGLHQRWREALPRVMRADGFSDRIIAAMMPAGELHVGKATDKKILGTIVETYKAMNWYEDALDDLDQRSHEFNHTPIIGAGHGFPHDCLLEFLESRAGSGIEAIELASAGKPLESVKRKETRKVKPPSLVPAAAALGHLGVWRITSMDYFNDDVLDIVEPPGIEFRGEGRGRMHFVALDADLDVQVRPEGGTLLLAWTWIGDDDGGDVSGRGDAVIKGDRMRGCIRIHRGDEMHFEATRLGS